MKTAASAPNAFQKTSSLKPIPGALYARTSAKQCAATISTNLRSPGRYGCTWFGMSFWPAHESATGSERRAVGQSALPGLGLPRRSSGGQPRHSAYRIARRTLLTQSLLLFAAGRAYLLRSFSVSEVRRGENWEAAPPVLSHSIEREEH